MQVVVISKPGGLERLELREAEAPRPGPGELSIATHAVGVNFADCVIRMGLYKSARHFVGWPITPGFELCGRVDSVGAGVDPEWLGRRVMAVTLFGAYATRVVVRREQVFEVPDGLDDAQAAAFPAVSLTAWYALCELCRLRPGMRALVHAGAGGVGLAATQIARRFGVEVVAVVGASHKVESSRRAGASAVVDRSRGPWEPQARAASPRGFDVVLDPCGGSTLRASRRLLRPTGRLVVYGSHTFLPRGRQTRSIPALLGGFLSMPRFSPLELIDDNVSVQGFNLSYLFERLDLLELAMRQLLSWLRAGELEPLPVTRFPFADVARAHRELQSGTTTGKLVLETDPASRA